MTLNSGSPVFRVSWLGFARGDPTCGLSVCFFFPALFVFCWALRPVLGRVFSPPKKWYSPLLEGRVCAEWQNSLSPHLSAGGPRATGWRRPIQFAAQTYL